MMFDFTSKQAEAINTLDKNIAVSAGAGSGKTRVLVERFINILRQSLKGTRQINITDILAITFTRKAASEMKERLSNRLSELEVEDAKNAEFWHKQANLLEQANINTIHGFCNKLLKENPVEANLDPAFQVAEEIEIDEFYQRTVRQFVKNGLRREDGNILRLAQEYTAETLIKQLLVLLPKFSEILLKSDLTLAYQPSIDMADNYKNTLKILVTELIDGKDSIKAAGHRAKLDLLSEKKAEVIFAIDNLGAPDSISLLERYIGGLTASSADKIVVKEAKDTLKEALAGFADEIAVTIIPCWQETIAACASYISRQQNLHNILGFDDLESIALNLLEKNSQVCKKNQDRYQYIMVDEFQDTNERQRQIVYLLCGGDKLNLKGEKLFVVGDAKQSIYRFRGADVSVFAKVREEIKKYGGKNISLEDNFRTVDKILDLCNRAFAKLLGEDKLQDVYFEPLAANRSTEIFPELLVLNYDKESKGKSRDSEAIVVAKKMLELHNQGIAYGEMVILLSALTHAKKFASALQIAGIPYVVVDGKGFYERQEIIDLINLLTFLDNSTRNLELAGVLRSPYFAIDDEVLTLLFAKLKDTGNKDITLWELLQDENLLDIGSEKIKQLRQAVAKLRELQQTASLLPLAELLRSIVSKLELYQLLSAQDFGLEKMANLKKLISLAEAFAMNNNASITDYLSRIAQLRQASAREASAIDNTNNDAVTIMTIHKSKGLEFPVVFVPNLDTKGRGDIDGVRFNEKIGLGIKVEIKGVLQETSVFALIKEQDKNLDLAEKQRQLYVAMTRAKDRLILSGRKDISSKSKTENWFSSLYDIAEDYDKIKILEYSANDISLEIEKSRNYDDVILNTELLNNIKALPEFGLDWQSSFSATSLQRYLYCQRSYYYYYVLKMPEILSLQAGHSENISQIDPKKRGIIIHRALELVALGYDKKIAMVIAAKENFLASVDLKTQTLYEKYLESDIYQAININNRQAEVAFELPLLDAWGVSSKFRGYIDCSVFNSDGTVSIVDYKTGAVPDKELSLGYGYQIALYARAAELIWNKQVKETEIHFLETNESWKVNIVPNIVLEEISKVCLDILKKRKEEEFIVNKSKCKNCPFSYFCPQK